MRINRIAIESVDDRRVGDFRIVSDPALMRERGLFVAEGRLAVERLLASRFRAHALLLTAGALARLEPALAACRGGEGGLDVYLADSARLRQITGFRFHRGCLALGMRPGGSVDGEGLAAGRSRPLVALEGVSNPDNVGSIFRNAAAFGAAGVVLSPTCADPLYRKAIRTSMGTTLTLPFRLAGEWPDALRRIVGGEALGTRFRPGSTHTESRKRWLLSGLSAGAGRFVIDEGAVRALRHNSRSLLPVGVVEVRGDFERGDIVAVEDAGGDRLAVGISNYGADEASQIQGQRSDRIEDLLGYHYGDEMIHRDNLVLL